MPVLIGPDRRAFERATEAMKGARATLAFVAVSVALFAIAERHGSTEDVEVLLRFGALERGHLRAGEVWRLVSSAFLHIGAGHLASNVIAMLGFCIPAERALGTARFAVLYLGAAVAAAAASLLGTDGVGAGASGAVYGVAAAHLVIARRRLPTWRVFLGDRTVGVVVFFLLLWTWGSFRTPEIDHAAHSGGFAAGAVLAWALTTPAGATLRSRRLAWAAALLAIVLPTARVLVPTRAEGVAAVLDEVGEAVERDDLDAADRALARAAEAGLSSVTLDYARAVVLEQRGDLDGAARAFEAMARSPDPEARRAGAEGAKLLLGERLLSGDGMERDPERGRRLLEEVCAGGRDDVCEWLRDAEGATPVAVENAEDDR